MTTNTAPSKTVPVEKLRSFNPGSASLIALVVGVVGIILTLIGFFVSPGRVTLSGLISISFWLSIGLGMLFLVMLHHIFDAGWSTSIRRQLEHGLAVFPWLGILFVPLLLANFFHGDAMIWKWTAPDLAPVAGDVLYEKKSAYLNNAFFIIRSIGYFAVWIGLSWLLRRASFSQDRDGRADWTSVNRKVAAAGLFLGGLTLTFASIDWIKSLDYHWFSTMFGVWYFAGSMRAALATILLICVMLVKFGVFQGIFRQSHMYEIGRLMLAFTIFWAYISFSQYFLIWNANIPEETFWFVVREEGNWWYVGLALVFCYSFVPFIFLLFYGNKTNTVSMVAVSIWVLVFHLVDLYFNILPSKLLWEDGVNLWRPVYQFPLFQSYLIWDLAALLGVGGVCVWAFLRSFVSQRPIPVRDPRILESVHHHG
jgi:hypothetical protein